MIKEEAIILIANNNIENFIYEKELYKFEKKNINILIEILRRAKNNSKEEIRDVFIEHNQEERKRFIQSTEIAELLE